MKITERDKVLLFILGMLVVFFLPFMLVVRPFSQKNEQLEKENADLEIRKSELLVLEQRRDEMVSEMEEAEEEKKELLASFPSALSQEENILFLHNTEQLVPITLWQSSYEQYMLQPVTAGNASGESADAAAENVSGISGDAAAATGLTGLCGSSQIQYRAGYENLKDFLKYILEYKNRMVISSINATYSADLSYVEGGMTLQQYAIMGADREIKNVKEPVLLHGSSNVFMQASGIAGSGGEESGQPDFFLMLSQPEADVDAVIFGQSMDGTEESYLTSEDNKVQEVAISFKGSEGSYTANYQIGEEKFSDDGGGISFEKDGAIVFEIISSPRVGDSDKVEVKLDVINRTDRKVIVTIKDDDEEKPRVSITGKTGEIVVQ